MTKRITDDRTLTAEQFNAALAALKWKQSEFARRTGMSTGAVNTWAIGKVAVPLWVGEYLGTLLDVAALHQKYLAPMKGAAPARQAHQQDSEESAQAPEPERPPGPAAD